MLPNPDHDRQRSDFIDRLRGEAEALATASGDAARSGNQIAESVLQSAAEANAELAGYIASPILEQSLSAFHESDAARREASSDLTAYLRQAGLDISDHAEFRLRDNNWCVDATVTVHVDGHNYSASGHYDSHTGFGTGVC